MPKQNAAINFSGGLNTKSDPWQLSVGQFLSLQNSVFSTQGQLKKRNGYGLVTTVPNATTVSTFNNNLVAIGSALSLYSEDTNTVINTGSFQPLGLSVNPMVRSATSQTTVDSAVAPSGLCCSTWLDSDGNTYYQINDSVTGTTIVPAIAITSATDVSATMSRVFVLGNYFVITYLATVSSTPTLRYIAIPLSNPSMPLAPLTISAQVSSISGAYDGVVAFLSPSILYLAWNGSDSGGAIRIATLTNTLALSSAITIATTNAALLSTTFDYSANQFWVTIYSSATTSVYAAAYTQNLTSVLAKTTLVSGISAVNQVSSAASLGTLRVFLDMQSTYGYDSTLRSDFIQQVSCTTAGTVSSVTVLCRSVGLASNAVSIYRYTLNSKPNIVLTSIMPPSAAYTLVSTTGYFLAVYGSAYQPTYFLMDGAGNVIAKLAYSNGGGYPINQVLPQLNVSSNSAGQLVLQVGYLFKDLLASIANPVGPIAASDGTNKTMGSANTLPVYTQSGINLAAMTLGSSVPTSETGDILHMGAGFPWMFDGVKPVEHQFHVWPDAVEVSSTNTGGGMLAQQYYYQAIYYWIDGQGNPQYSAPSIPISTTVAAGSGVTFTSVFASGATSITVSSATGLFVGQILTDTTTAGNITANTTITSIVGTTVTLSQPTAGASASSPGDTLKTVNQGTATINIPTLRLTYKTSNKVRIRLFRWSTANQNFYEVTSIASPTLNDPTQDSVTIVDHLNDAAVVGNSLLYTTGGTVEDIAAPSFSVSTLFDDRLWVVDAEDPNTLWFSKQVIEGTGVEFSDLLTFYVAPTQGAQGSTGPITALCPMDVELVIFKKDAIYYINGTGPDNTGANNQYSQPIFITSTVGCANPNSIVFTDAGLMFQSDKGIWLLGRNLQTSYIGANVEGLVLGNTVTSAMVIPETTQVRFTLSTGITVMYDYLYGQWGSFSNTPAISSTLYNGLQTYLNQYGQILQETPGAYLDITTPVQMSFTTSWLNLAALQGFERFYNFYLVGRYLSPHKLQIELSYDYVSTFSQSTMISPANFSSAVPSPYGDQPAPFGATSDYENWEIFPQIQKCQAFQITINEIYDPSLGVPAGAGLTLSGLNLTVGIKRGSRPIPVKYTAG